jgi:ribonucleoside-diphosphate reductase alpha chain
MTKKLLAPAYSPDARAVLQGGGILAEGETPDDMITRVLDALVGVELAFGTSPWDIETFKEEAAEILRGRLATLGTPILTNAGREPAALSACISISPVESPRIIEAHYRQCMGGGYDLDEVEDPVATVRKLNAQAAELTARGGLRRPIANMASLPIDHPRVLEFATLKAARDDIRHFNLSVAVTPKFMRAREDGTAFTLRDGTRVDAGSMWATFAECAWRGGEPGLIFPDRFDADNPTPSLGAYGTTAPCGEVGLALGEACIFGYLNHPAFLTAGGVDFALLPRTTATMVRLLDDAVEVSLPVYPTERSRTIMGAKRKIGIGVCGYADLLVRLGLPYGSEGATRLLRDILTTISYHSKRASVALAAARGSFPAFSTSRFLADDGFLMAKYGRLKASVVSAAEWASLDKAIRAGGIRNAVTTALPPSGRSARLLDASSSIEPWFGLLGRAGEPKPALVAAIEAAGLSAADRDAVLETVRASGTCQGCDELPLGLREVLRRAVEIPAAEHLRVVAEAGRSVDEGASKTINLPREASAAAVESMFDDAWRLDLKAISVYRDGSRANQPEGLSGHPGRRGPILRQEERTDEQR